MTILNFCLFIDPIDKVFLGHLDQRYLNHGPQATQYIYLLLQRFLRFEKKKHKRYEIRAIFILLSYVQKWHSEIYFIICNTMYLCSSTQKINSMTRKNCTPLGEPKAGKVINVFSLFNSEFIIDMKVSTL